MRALTPESPISSLLLSLVQDRFDVLVTIDQGLEFEHNLKKLRFGLVIVHVPKNKVEFYRPVALERGRPWSN